MIEKFLVQNPQTDMQYEVNSIDEAMDFVVRESWNNYVNLTNGKMILKLKINDDGSKHITDLLDNPYEKLSDEHINAKMKIQVRNSLPIHIFEE